MENIKSADIVAEIKNSEFYKSRKKILENSKLLEIDCNKYRREVVDIHLTRHSTLVKLNDDKFSINLVTAILDNQAKRSRLVGILQELSTPVEFLKEFIHLTKNKIALDFEHVLATKRSREDRNAIIDLALDKDFIRKLLLYTQLIDMVREAIKDIDASSINLGYCANLLSSENKRR